jgi:hypothetical protein
MPVVTFFTTIIVALCVVADQDSIYQHMSRIDLEINKIILAEDADK